MRVVVVGMGGIGNAVAKLLVDESHEVIPINRAGSFDRWAKHGPADWVVCCNGTHDSPFEDCFERTVECSRWAKNVVALSGGGVGGPPKVERPDLRYVASKAALTVWIEWAAATEAYRQFFCVAPGLTATKMTGYKGADPRIPAAFIVKLLSGKYGHLSGSLLAAQRDDLDTMKPMKLRRVECP